MEQSQLELKRTNFKFELPFSDSSSTNNHLHFLSVYNGNVNTFSQCHSRQVNVATWFSVLLIDIEENLHRLPRGLIYIYMIYIYIHISSSFLHNIFAIPPAESKFTGWAIMEELSIHRRVRTFLISWGQKTRVWHCYQVILIYRHDMSSGLQEYVSIWMLFDSFWIFLQQSN